MTARATSGTTRFSSRGNRREIAESRCASRSGGLQPPLEKRRFGNRRSLKPARRKGDFESGRIQRQVRIVKWIVHELCAPGGLHVFGGAKKFGLFFRGALMAARSGLVMNEFRIRCPDN